jgi:hypothetical protein
MSKLDKSIDGNAIKAIMYLEQAESAIGNIVLAYYDELRVAEAKGDMELVDFITSNTNALNSIENKLNSYKDYLNNVVGLGWEAYKQSIEIKKKNDETNPDN